MNELLEIATIKLEIKMQGFFLAKVTLNWRDAFEVRFLRLCRSKEGNLWLQAPKLRDQGWAVCFAVVEKDEWRELAKKVIEQFKVELKEKINEGVYAPSILKNIEEAEEEDISIDDIPENLGKT
jgi:hypothetical protein